MVRNERGIALVLVLILALISLAIVSALLYMATIGTRTSGAEKFYRTADEAAYGGTRIAVDMIVTNLDSASTGGALSAPLPALGTVLSLNQPCLRQKWSLPPGVGFANWTQCNANERSLDASVAPDMTFQLSGATADGMPNPDNVFAKVVDTIEGNTAGVAGGESGLSTGGVGGGGAAVITPQRRSWMFRVEVEAEDAVNQRERSRYSVLYAH
jgi:hypothetical protein